MWKLLLIVMLAACPRREQFPCGTTQVDLPREEAGNVRLVHGSHELSIRLPDEQVRAHAGGGPKHGVVGPAYFVSGVMVSAKTPAGMLQVHAPLGDVRTLDTGTHVVRVVRTEYRDCIRPDFCPHRCDHAGTGVGTVEVTEAEGGPLDYPEVVTANFHRKFRVRVKADNVTGKLTKNTEYRNAPATCSPISYDIDVTFVVDRRDFKSNTRMCGGH